MVFEAVPATIDLGSMSDPYYCPCHVTYEQGRLGLSSPEHSDLLQRNQRLQCQGIVKEGFKLDFLVTHDI